MNDTLKSTKSTFNNNYYGRYYFKTEQEVLKRFEHLLIIVMLHKPFGEIEKVPLTKLVS